MCVCEVNLRRPKDEGKQRGLHIPQRHSIYAAERETRGYSSTFAGNRRDVEFAFCVSRRLSEKRQAQFLELSTGQQRRLALALAVSHDPQVLFLDEPTAGLDVASRVELHDVVRELQASGTTTILATHDMAEAEEMSDRVAILLEGEIATIGTPMEITAAGRGLTKVSVRTVNGSLSDPGITFPAVSQRGSKEEYDICFSTDIGPTVAAIIAYIEAHGDTLIDLRVERPSLEDRFLEITRPESTNEGGAR